MIAAAAAIGCLVGVAIGVFVCTTITRAIVKQHETEEFRRYEERAKTELDWHKATREELQKQIEESKRLPLAVARVYNPISKDLKELKEQMFKLIGRVAMLEKRKP